MTNISNLSDILGQKDLELLTTAERTAYNTAFATFKAAHAAQYPNGQPITLPISKVSMLPDTQGNYRFELKAGPNTYSPVFKFKPVTADIMLKNSLQLPVGVVIPILVRSLNKGAFKTIVKVVDETDTYVDKDRVENNYAGPGVARFENSQVEYVPSAEVTSNAQGAYLRIEELQLSKMLTDMDGTTPVAIAAPVVAANADEDEI